MTIINLILALLMRGYDLYLLAIAKLLNSKYSRLLSFYFHTLIQQRLDFLLLEMSKENKSKFSYPLVSRFYCNNFPGYPSDTRAGTRFILAPAYARIDSGGDEGNSYKGKFFTFWL
ncbi:MAG: hypothetical protein QNJ68_14660 [Microcoleaceae cyanobacterium MO_207.B10]|nr:hypothetical protein [Microcoleaceae cyanobacterium MO_207.B10]